MHYLIFWLEEQRHALPLEQIERVVRAVEVTPLPQGEADSAMRGFINVHGAIVPVFDLRGRKAVDAHDEMILAVLPDGRHAALLCNRVEGVQQLAQNDVLSTRGLLPESYQEHVMESGVMKDEAGIIHLHHLDALLAHNAELITQLEANEAPST